MYVFFTGCSKHFAVCYDFRRKMYVFLLVVQNILLFVTIVGEKFIFYWLHVRNIFADQRN